MAKNKLCPDCGESISQQAKRCRSCAIKAKWRDPEYRQKMEAHLGSPERRRKFSKQRKAAWAKRVYGTKQWRHKQSEAQKAAHKRGCYSSEETRRKKSEASRIAHARGDHDGKYTEEAREKLSKATKAAWERGDHDGLSDAMKAAWENGVFDDLPEVIKEAWARGDFDSEETRQKFSETSKAAWENPDYRRRVLEAISIAQSIPGHHQKKSKAAKAQWARGDMDGVFKSPSSLEIEIAKALDDCGISYIQQYKLEGDGRPFDFFVPPNLLVEVDGEYWHSQPGRKERDRAKAELAISQGFTFLRIKEREVKALGALAVVKERICPVSDKDR